ncbi:hypothetical protein BV25DRAFT_1902428 [Artomyces pyxidatus]|uniref:Uncharacterized protein n=1 Tax=Artomyces pyxidatus TaxID=48021 RepID=A0ACB8SQL2_9AGAM|nr:hypothetical protein BV25DRAFT_1902428 [Artomyces pyxidatus]
MPSCLAHFASLHGLTQVIPSGNTSQKYFLLSSVGHDTWQVHVGDDRGKWWEGAWHDEDVRAIAGKNTSPQMLSAFSTRLKDTIIKQDITITDENGAMKLMLGPDAKKPLHVDLEDMSAREGAIFAARQFMLIAQDAQERDCRLLTSSPLPSTSAQVSPSKRRRLTPPEPAASSSTESEAPPVSRKAKGKAAAGRTSSTKPQAKTEKATPTQGELAALEQVRALKAELAKAAEKEKERERGTNVGGSTDALRSRAVVPAAPRRAGASLANPNKKARKIQAIEFASDSD